VATAGCLTPFDHAGRILLALLLAVRAVAAQEDAAALVRTSFERYRQAVLAEDGAVAAALVTAGSHAYYARMRDLALHASCAELRVLPPADRLTVLRLRHEFTAEELAPLSGAALIGLSVAERWSASRTLRRLTLGEVELRGEEEAVAVVHQVGAEASICFLFRHEGGDWKLDLAHLARASDPALTVALQACAERTGADPDEVLVRMVENASGHLVDKDLWAPLDPAGR
jgi:hypothetical protein